MFKTRFELADGPEQLTKLYREGKDVIVMSDTGSGKSTGILRWIAEMKIKGKGMVTVPTRKAAIEMANFCNETFGPYFAYAVHGDSYYPKGHRAVVSTAGWCWRKMANCDGDLKSYEFICVDEAHMKGNDTQLMIGFLRRLRTEGNLKFQIIVASATISGREFITLFPNMKEIVVPCSKTLDQLNPIYYMDDEFEARREDQNRGQDREPLDDMINVIVDMVEKQHLRPFGVDVYPTLEDIENNVKKNNVENETENEDDVFSGGGHLLVFCSGKKEIEYLQSCLLEIKTVSSVAQIVPFYGTQDDGESDVIFDKSSCDHGKPPLIILATNIAQSSMTIRGVRFILSSGFHKVLYQDGDGCQNIKTERCCSSDLIQARGRAGRIATFGAGYTIMMMSRAKFDSLNVSPLPEYAKVPAYDMILGLCGTRYKLLDILPEVGAKKVQTDTKYLVDMGIIVRRDLKESKDSKNSKGSEYQKTERGEFVSSLPIGFSRSGFLELVKCRYPQGLQVATILVSILDIPMTPFWKPRPGSGSAEEINAADKKARSFYLRDCMSTLLNVYIQFDGCCASKDKQEIRETRKEWCRQNYINAKCMHLWSRTVSSVHKSKCMQTWVKKFSPLSNLVAIDAKFTNKVPKIQAIMDKLYPLATASFPSNHFTVMGDLVKGPKQDHRDNIMYQNIRSNLTFLAHQNWVRCSRGDLITSSKTQSPSHLLALSTIKTSRLYLFYHTWLPPLAWKCVNAQCKLFACVGRHETKIKAEQDAKLETEKAEKAEKAERAARAAKAKLELEYDTSVDIDVDGDDIQENIQENQQQLSRMELDTLSMLF